ATNAGGTRALRHGTMRANVAGLEAVLADGTLLRRLNGLPKDNAGYDLPALIVGSEGTLAVVTRVRLRLVPSLPLHTTLLCGQAGGLLDTAVASAAGDRAALWAYREQITDAVQAEGVPHKLDVSVPIPALAEFDQAVRAAVAEVAPTARTILFGHLGDGNLHV